MTPSLVTYFLVDKLSHPYYFGIFLACRIISTIYVMVWDYYMDWGLFRGTKPGHKILRDKLTFSKSFYYTCIVINFLIRWFWIIPLVVYNDSQKATLMNKLKILTVTSMMLEAIRRTLWAIIRIENESINNFENYRPIVAIPPLVDELDLDQ